MINSLVTFVDELKSFAVKDKIFESFQSLTRKFEIKL